MSSFPMSYRHRAPYASPRSRGAPEPVYACGREHGMIIERNVGIPLREGVRIFADVFRPLDEQPAAPLIAWSPYGKHIPNDPQRVPGAGLNPLHMSALAPFEGPDPLYWVPRGYAVVVIDKPGTWHSEGTATYLSPEEAQDFRAAIEWAGTQPWSNGRVGLTGVSYLASSQWRVAELNPPHLAAINPWEGWADTYREVAYHGGIPDTWFWPYLWRRWGTSSSAQIEDWEAEMREHPLWDDFWRSKAADFARIRMPAYIVASWSDQGLHTRGTLEGFKHMASPDKWLEVHGRKKWAYYYEPAHVARLQAFFDHFLRGQPTQIADWPRVRLEIRESAYVGRMRAEQEWPLARTQYTPLHLDAARGALAWEAPTADAELRYEAVPGLPQADHARFEIQFAQATEITGHMKLRIHMSAEGSDDMDVFVGLQKIGQDGMPVGFPYYAQFEDGPLALGWLRASHRELDRERSTEHQPVLAHESVRKIEPGAVVALDIEIWPSSTRFEAGERLRLIVQGSDIYKCPKIDAPVYFRHEASVNRGLHVIHTGPARDSYLLVPVIPG